MSDFVIKQNDTRPVLDAELQNTDGTSIDLTSCTVKFFMVSTIGTQLKVNALCGIIDAVNGKVRYSWQAADTSDYGDYKAEFQITFPDGSIQTVPNDGYVTASIVKDIA